LSKSKSYSIEEIELLELYLTLRSQNNFLDYRKFINKYEKKTNWFYDEISNELQKFYIDLEAGRRPKLIIQAPPQHGKTTAIVEFISWLVGKNPNHNIVYSSFSERLGVRANLMLQRIFDSEKYKSVFDTRINERNIVTMTGHYLRNKEILEFVNTTGYFRNTTVQGSITGETATLAILDDPIKGREFANSPVIRDKTWEWMTNDLFTRFTDKAGFIAILTRWHIDDPIGRLIERDKSLRILTYPALATQDEKHRKEGEALFPELKSKEFLFNQKSILGALNFESLYQQNPTIEMGSFFNRDNFKYYSEDDYYYYFGTSKILKSELPIYQTIDPAGTENKTSDYFGAVTFGVYDNNILVLDTFKEKAETTRHELILQNLRDKWNPKMQGVENKTFGINLIQNAKKKGFPLYPLSPKRREGKEESKTMRAEPLDLMFRNGMIYFNKNCSELEKELLEFPNGKHDDLVDCLAYAVIMKTTASNNIVDVWNSIYNL
jgi:predicted phage terminase large subunit-like protein